MPARCVRSDCWYSWPGNRLEPGIRAPGAPGSRRRCGRASHETDLGKLPNILRTALNEARTKALVQRNRQEHNRLVADFNQILETHRIGLEAITPVRRLTEPELVQLLYQSLNPADC